MMVFLSKEHTPKWRAGLIAASVLLSVGVFPMETGHAAVKQAQSVVDKSEVVLKSNGTVTEHNGIFREGEVWIPLTYMRDVLQMPLTYDKNENSYTIGKGTTMTKIMVSGYGNPIYVNKFFIREYEGKMINNRLYVPFGLLNDYLGYKGDYSSATSRLNILSRPKNPLTITTESYVKDTKSALIKLDYPKVRLNRPNVQKAINDVLKDSTLKFAAGAEADIANKTGEEQIYAYDSSYVVTYNQDNVLSLVMYQYSDTGGAHGMTYRQAFTFSLKDGKQLLLGDLFGANPNYKKELNAKLNKLVKAEGGYLGGFNGLTTEKYFYLKEDKVVLFFQLYEYTAYASGIPEYTFSFKELLPDGSSPFASLK